MAASRRGVDVKLKQFCPNCNSKNLIRNGHPHNGKLEFFCKSCNKYFTIDSLKGYPPTNIPFPVIAYLLYFRKKTPEFSNMRKYRKFVNHWLKYLKVSDQEVSRQTIHHWIKNFDNLLDNVITFLEASDFCKSRLNQLIKVRPPQKVIPYRRTLKILERKFGKTNLLHLIKKDEAFFKELVELVSKHGVFGWEFIESDFGGDSVGYRPLPGG